MTENNATLALNVTSCKNLTMHQAHTFIEELEKLALKVEQEQYQKQMKETRQQVQNPGYTGHPIRFELDTESGSNWTPNPVLTGQ